MEVNSILYVSVRYSVWVGLNRQTKNGKYFFRRSGIPIDDAGAKKLKFDYASDPNFEGFVKCATLHHNDELILEPKWCGWKDMTYHSLCEIPYFPSPFQ